ncbi:2-methoxy-6-polyprenyl-1,4-benzoquinol methylase [subsurface metagenome]
MDVFEWIEKELKPKACNSEEFMYDEMDSQSGCCLPIIYQPFDTSKKSHWRDRGSLFDFLFSTDGTGKRLLDFGPGDGWPSLIVAPFVDEVVGVDGSQHRVDVCAENANRLGISNARFLCVEPGNPLPFEENSFDGIMAASSVEQTPDPKEALKELYRVLKPGGRIRMNYEALSMYKGGKERECYFDKIYEGTCSLTIYDRHIDEEYAVMYKVIFSESCKEIFPEFIISSGNLKDITFNTITIPILEKLKPVISAARICTLTHPSGKTLFKWLKDIGFSEIHPTHSGSWFAGRLFENVSKETRPKKLKELDELLQPVVKIVVQMPAPIESNPMMTAIR